MTSEITADASKKPVPPYLAYRTFVNLLNGWHVHLPQRIDRTVLGTYAGGTQSAILSTMRSLALLHNDDTPTGTLKQLAESEGAERQKLLKQVIRTGYPFLYAQGFDLAKASPAMLTEKFAQTGASGETLNKCLSFFTAMAKDAGVSLTPFLKTRKRREGNGKRSVKAKPATTDTGAPHAEETPTGFARLPIPGVENAYIQYPNQLTDGNCDMFEAMVGVLRTYAKGRAGKEKKS